MNPRARVAGIWWVLIPLLVACGSQGSGDAGGKNGPSCLFDDECPGGSCVDGKCFTFQTGDDLGGQEAGTKPDADILADLTSADAADVTQGSDQTVVPDVPRDVPPVGELKPEIMVDPEQHTFTYIPGANNPLTKTVTIYNQGKLSLNVTKIQWSSGSSPEFQLMALPPLPKKLNPYDQTALTVLFKEKNPHGPATLEIHSDDPLRPVVTVLFRGESKTGEEPCVQIQPSSLNFGQVVRGQSKTLPFKVVNCSSTLPVTISQIKRSQFFGMALTSEFQMNNMPPGQFTILGNQVVELSVTYAPGLAGVDNGYFSFIPTDSSLGQPKLDVYGVGLPPPMEDIGLHIELEWDKPNCDVDLHLVRPGGTLFDCKNDCYYANRSPEWGVAGNVADDPFLDYDDVDGYGPENTNLSEPEAGTYKVTMHYYNDSYEGSTGGPTKVTVRIFSYGNLLGTYGPKTLTHTDHTWDVANVKWPGATITVLDTLYEAPQQPVCFNW